tara:strand:- start:37 stop:609 length:573 start_codon:yes stop_codon:yes gene_type:complete
MTYKIEYYYPIRVYSGVAHDYQSINYQIDKVIDKVDFKMVDRWGPTHYISTDFTSTKEVDILKDLRLHKVKKMIDDHLRAYCSELKFPVRDYHIENWFSLFKKGNYAHIHDHGSADISGVYYYKTNEKDSEIFFQAPFPYRKSFEVDYYEIIHKPTPGGILLFPGWFKHGVRTSTSDRDRISLSFNIEFK